MRFRRSSGPRRALLSRSAPMIGLVLILVMGTVDAGTQRPVQSAELEPASSQLISEADVPANASDLTVVDGTEFMLSDLVLGGNGIPKQFLIDHFKCYSIKTQRLEPTVVKVLDQFGAVDGRVTRPLLLCNPAVKNDEGEIRNAQAHLECFKLTDAEKFQKREVLVIDQFGEEQVRALKPDLLCLPSFKFEDRPPVPIPGEPEGLDHFKCYRIKAPKFNQTPVTLQDQFNPPPAQPEATLVVKALLLCNPAVKNPTSAGEGPNNPRDHLKCYVIRRPRGAPKFQPRNVFVQNQFFTQPVPVQARVPKLLCNPALKNELPPG